MKSHIIKSNLGQIHAYVVLQTEKFLFLRLPKNFQKNIFQNDIFNNVTFFIYRLKYLFFRKERGTPIQQNFYLSKGALSL